MERSIRDQLSTRESTLIYNAHLEKAAGDRKAALDLGNTTDAPALRDTLRLQADLAERLAEEFI
jgi:hypothetical protein